MKHLEKRDQQGLPRRAELAVRRWRESSRTTLVVLKRSSPTHLCTSANLAFIHYVQNALGSTSKQQLHVFRTGRIRLLCEALCCKLPFGCQDRMQSLTKQGQMGPSNLLSFKCCRAQTNSVVISLLKDIHIHYLLTIFSNSPDEKPRCKKILSGSVVNVFSRAP